MTQTIDETTAPLPPSAHPLPAGARRTVPTAVALIAASLPMFLATLDNLVMTTALPVIQRDLGASIGGLQWMMNAYTLAFSALMITASGLGDRWGRRRVFVSGITLFALGSIGSGLATTTATLVVARAVQGAGAAAIMPLSLTLLAAAVPAARRAMAIGIWGAISGMGVALGPVIGGAVVDGISWQAIFWINIPLAAIAIPLILRALPESYGRRDPIDVWGAVTAGAGVCAVVWGVVHGNDDGWTSTTVLGSFAAGAAILGLFVWHESRTAFPMIPLRLFRVRSFTTATVAAFAFSAGVFGSVFLLAQYLQVAMGYSAFDAGLRTLPWTAAPMVVAPLAGLIAPRLGVRPLLVTGLAFQAVGLAWLASQASTSTTYGSLIPGLLLAGVGMGLTFAPSSTAILADMAPDDHGVASSSNATLREVGIALGVAALVAVFQGAGGAMTPADFPTGLRPAVLVGAVTVAAGAVIALGVPRRTGKER